jgi:hypothetical protein
MEEEPGAKNAFIFFMNPLPPALSFTLSEGDFQRPGVESPLRGAR